MLLCLALTHPFVAHPSDWIEQTFVRSRVADLLRHMVGDARRVTVGGQVVELGSELYRFYAGRRFQPAWLGTPSAFPAAEQVLGVLKRAEDHGLDVDRYRVGAIEARLANDAGAVALAQADVLLTRAFLRYAADLGNGRVDPRRIDTDWFIHSESRDLSAYLQRRLIDGDVASVEPAMAPARNGYRRLLDAFARYRRIQEQGGWPEIPPGADLVPGTRDSRVTVLRERLRITGDLQSGTSDGQLFDDHLKRAVRRFQRRHGLAEDSWVGPDTLEALNIPVEERVRQIGLNLERWRWLPRREEPRYMTVNMAGFRLTAVENGETVMRMPVIVGRDHRQTPALRSAIESVVLNPYWYIPQTVFEEDLLPRLRDDPTYLQRANLKVLSSLEGQGTVVDPAQIDWNAVDPEHFPYILRQSPGARNALGRVKFTLPNDFGIYLHDTPDQDLFSSRVRTYSSGCIRVRDPVDLAAYVLRGQSGWDRQRVREAVASGTPRKVALDDPVPIYLVYMTAWADARGGVHFRNDVYGRDRRLAEALWPYDVLHVSRRR